MRIHGCIGLILAVTCTAAAQDKTHLRVQRAVKKFVAETPEGARVVGVGSWTTGKGYTDVLADGTSDHDLRFVPTPGSTDEEALAQWKQARNRLRGHLIEEFGTTDADKILRKTNLYAPQQLMRNVEDTADAARFFEKSGAVPTLSHSTKVDKAAAARYSEGLYGKGAKAWTQFYERTKGRTFYSHKGRAYSSSTDMLHRLEGRGKFTASGMGNTATGWIEHAVDELKHGDARALAKQLDRVDRDLNKGRELARMGADDAYRADVKKLLDDIKKPGANLKALTGRIDDVLKRGKFQAAILKRMDDAGPVKRVVLQTLMQSAELNNKAWKAIKKVAGKVPYGAILDGVVISAMAYSVTDTALNRSTAEALAKAIPDLAGVAPGILVEITDACLEEAKTTGYTLVANRQDAMDLIAGIHTARGREQAFERTGKKYDVEDIDYLVRTYRTRRKLAAFVAVRAHHASARDAGEATGQADAKVAQAIYDKCFPYILRLWERKRDSYRREYIRLLNKLRTAPFVMTYTPNPAVLPADGSRLQLILKAHYLGVDMVKVRNRMRELLRILTVGGVYVDTDVQFSAKGTKGAEPRTLNVTASKPGTYNTSVTITDVCGAAQPGDARISEQRASRTASLEIVVEAAQPVAGVTGSCRGPYKGAYTPHKKLQIKNLSRKGWVHFRITGTRVKGAIAGEEGKGVLTGTFDPVTRTVTASAPTKHVNTGLYTITGTYNEATGTFTGTYKAIFTPWRGKHRFTETGTWTAKGRLKGLPKEETARN